VPDPTLVAEVADIIGSAREAAWLVESVEPGDGHTDQVRALAERRRAGEPLQYLVGRWPFRDLELSIDPRVLIPRPETEQVVETALRRWRATRPQRERLTIVDLGCGSGAMGLSLFSELRPEVSELSLVLADVSSGALDVAADNADALEIPPPELCRGSWFEALDRRHHGSIGLLVSNPPYVDDGLRGSLAPELDHEPDLALYSGPSSDGVAGFADLEVIIAEMGEWILPGGVFALEMAEHQVDAALSHAKDQGISDVEGFDDLAGKPRGIVGSCP
jgi:release factor glutamine methyltransferase